MTCEAASVIIFKQGSTLYLALGVMASLRFPKDLILKVLEVSKMENSPLFDGIREEWEARGVVKGREEGMFEMLLDALEAKFGRIPDELRNRLGTIKGQEAIKQIMRKVISSNNIEDFMAKLEH